MKNIRKRTYIALQAGISLYCLLLIFSCVADDYPASSTSDDLGDDAIRFSSSSAHVLTRTGEKRNYFLANTLFRLHTLISKPALAVTDPAYWQADNRVEPIYDAISTATPLGQGAINYRDYTPTKSVARFEKRTIDVYGVTYNVQATGEVNQDLEPKVMSPLPADQIPRYKLQVDTEDNDSLPDLLRGEAKGRRAEDGIYVPMVFKHTASRLRFEILTDDEVWQAEEGRKREIRLNNITLKSMHSEGVLNLATGLYELDPAAPLIDRVFYHSDEGLELTDDASTNVPRHMLLFPATLDANRKIEIDFVFTIDGVQKNGSVFLENVTLKPNFDYFVSFMLLTDDVQLAIFSPEVYEWIDIPIGGEDGEEILGNVITFGGVTWMDRNLGAKSADVEGNWDKCRGAYFQFGRSIPYYFDQAKWDALTDAQRTAHPYGRPQLMGDCPAGISDGLGFFYTFDENGNRVYDAKELDRNCHINNLAVAPGEEKSRAGGNEPYTFVKCDTGGANGIWLVNTGLNGKPDIPGDEAAIVSTLWDAPDKDPCPKGWKVPSSKDYESFLPEKDAGLVNISWYTQTNLTIVTNGSATEDRAYGRVHGEQGVFLMKNKGSQNAYIIRIRLRRVLDAGGAPIRLNTSTATAYKQYYEISRYNVTADAAGRKQTTFAGLNQTTFSQRYTTAFLSAPVEVMAFPAYGQIGLTQDAQKGLADDGSSALMKTTTPTVNAQGVIQRGRAVLGYLRAETDAFGIKDSSRSPGQQIRCVRDYDAY